MTLPPLLLTSSVNVFAPFTKISDPTLRIELTLKSIEKWISIDKYLKIIICDGSNYDFSTILSNKFPKNDIECLFFNNNSKAVALYGKGYGEGEIVQYALEKSILLNNTKYFAKCTSKLWVDNYLECLKYWNNKFLCDCDFSYFKHNIFMQLKSVDTAFYITDKQYYIDHFLFAHKNVRENKRHWLEHCFKDIILSNEIDGFMFPVAPIILGSSGTRGVEYNYSILNKVNDKIKRILIKKSNLYMHYISR